MDRGLLLQHYAAVVEALDDAVVGHDASGTIISWNAKAERMFGFQAVAMVGQPVSQVVPGGRAGEALLRHIGRGERVHHHRTQLLRQDGREVEVELTLTPLRDEAGRLIGGTMVASDATGVGDQERALQHFAALVESCDDAIISKRLDGRVLSWNPAAERLYGYSGEEMIGNSIAIVATPDRVDEIPALMRKVARGKHVRDFQTVRRRKDGTLFDTELTLSPIRDNDGDVVAISVIARDVTEVRRNAQALQHYRALVESSERAIIGEDLDGRVISWNPAAERLFGYRPEEAIGRCAEFLAPPDHGDEAPVLMEKVRRGKKVEHFETVRRRKDGTLVDVQFSLFPIRDEDGDIVGASVVARDITARTLEERMMRHYRALVEASDDAIIGETTEGIIVSWNPGAERLYGYSAEEMMGQHISRLAPPDRQDEIGQFLHRVAQGERVTNHETRLVRKDGTLVDVSATLSPIRDERGQVTGISAIDRDITAVKRAEEMRITGEAAVRSSLAKSQFLASMSHEIRTPMNAIIGMADLLQETDLSIDQREFVRIFRDAGSMLLDIINDILDLSKVEAGELRLASDIFNLIETVESVFEVLAVRAHEKKLELNDLIAPDVPNLLVGDSGRLRQVLMNLVGNAIKFTRQGEVTLRVHRDPERREPGVLLFSVTDTGEGISPDERSRIFQPFQQTGGPSRQGGTGLGLSISRRLVELMGGRMWVESQTGLGSTFYFTVRFGIAPVAQVRPSAPPELRGTHVMVVDDNATNRIILHQLLAQGGARVEVADGARTALIKLRQAAVGGDPVRLLLLDCRMPDGDGFSVAEEIEGDRRLDPIIMMLTSDHCREDMEKVRRMGLSAYLVKPVRTEHLYRVVQSALRCARSAGPGEKEDDQPALPGEAGHPANRHRPRVLLVDDEDVNRYIVLQFLKDTPYHVDVASNGAEAVEHLQASEYDVILMDMRMPVMDGYEATRRIRSIEKRCGRAPAAIIALTASVVGEEVRLALEAGSTAHVAKPVARGALLELLQRYATAR